MHEFLKRQRREWAVAAILLTILAWLLICLCSSCQGKKTAPPKPTTLLVVDTTRLQIRHRVSEAEKGVLILQERNQTNQHDYEAAAADYDSTFVDLP